jgi:hypothetical protein
MMSGDGRIGTMSGCLLLALLALAEPPLETSAERTTRLYVRTLPPGAEIILDGQPLGHSDGLFVVPPGVRRVIIDMDDYRREERQVEVPEGEIVRVVVELEKQVDRTAEEQSVIVDDGTAEQRRSLGGSGHAMRFTRPEGLGKVVAVEMFASRYGHPEPPQEDFTLYLLDGRQEVMGQFAVAYSSIERGEMRWYRLPLDPTNVPERFGVALSFNPHQTKGIYLGMDCDAKAPCSYTGLPETGFTKLDESGNWMIRPILAK